CAHRSHPYPPLFPYTTLFRSRDPVRHQRRAGDDPLRPRVHQHSDRAVGLRHEPRRVPRRRAVTRTTHLNPKEPTPMLITVDTSQPLSDLDRQVLQAVLADTWPPRSEEHTSEL